MYAFPSIKVGPKDLNFCQRKINGAAITFVYVGFNLLKHENIYQHLLQKKKKTGRKTSKQGGRLLVLNSTRVPTYVHIMCKKPTLSQEEPTYVVHNSHRSCNYITEHLCHPKYGHC